MTDGLARLRAREAPMVEALETLVVAESPSDDDAALERCRAAISALFAARLGTAPDDVTVDGVTHLRWSGGGEPRVLVLGHYDTVWPTGTLARHPFAVRDGVATGPGSFDMKAGIVQIAEGLSTLDDLSGVVILLTADEESGSATSRGLVQECARTVRAALVAEPSAAGGALKTARKGTGMYTLRVHGLASHAGLEPEKGINSLLALAPLIPAAFALGRPDVGTTVTPTMAAAGTATNVVPALASVELDVRVWLPEEADRVDEAVRALTVDLDGATLEVVGGPNRPPLPESMSVALMQRAVVCASRLGLPSLKGVGVGGASDGNFTAAAGTPTLDGLGAVGDGAHAESEHVVIGAMAERAALLAALVADLRN